MASEQLDETDAEMDEETETENDRDLDSYIDSNSDGSDDDADQGWSGFHRNESVEGPAAWDGIEDDHRTSAQHTTWSGFTASTEVSQTLFCLVRWSLKSTFKLVHQ